MFKMAIERYKINKSINYRNIIPLYTLILDLVNNELNTLETPLLEFLLKYLEEGIQISRADYKKFNEIKNKNSLPQGRLTNNSIALNFNEEEFLKKTSNVNSKFSKINYQKESDDIVVVDCSICEDELFNYWAFCEFCSSSNKEAILCINCFIKHVETCRHFFQEKNYFFFHKYNDNDLNNLVANIKAKLTNKETLHCGPIEGLIKVTEFSNDLNIRKSIKRLFNTKNKICEETQGDTGSWLNFTEKSNFIPYIIGTILGVKEISKKKKLFDDMYSQENVEDVLFNTNCFKSLVAVEEYSKEANFSPTWNPEESNKTTDEKLFDSIFFKSNDKVEEKPKKMTRFAGIRPLAEVDIVDEKLNSSNLYEEQPDQNALNMSNMEFIFKKKNKVDSGITNSINYNINININNNQQEVEAVTNQKKNLPGIFSRFNNNAENELLISKNKFNSNSSFSNEETVKELIKKVEKYIKFKDLLEKLNIKETICSIIYSESSASLNSELKKELKSLYEKIN